MMNRVSKSILLFGVSFMLLTIMSCEEDFTFLPPDEQFEKDQKAIDKYLDKNGIDAEIEPESGLRYVIHEEGTGDSPLLSDTVKVNYTGFLLGGEQFEENEDITFNLNQVLLGWRIGLRLIKEGGRITIYVPSGYAYGPQGSGDAIPRNANLIFDIELIEFL